MNRPLIFMLTSFVLTPLSYLAGAEFIEIGVDLGASGVSADGRVVVGWARNEIEAYVWSRDDGLRMLGSLPGHTESRARGVSADGSIVVGWSGVGGPSEGEVFLWTEDGGMTGIGNLPGFNRTNFAPAISDDGSTVVGTALGEGPVNNESQAFRWTQNEGVVSLLPEDQVESFAHGVSADGSVIAVATREAGNVEGFRWDEENGFQSLGSKPSGFEGVSPLQVSADGKVIMGDDTFGFSTGKAFRWTDEEGIQPLPGLPSEAEVFDLSPDGSIAVGFDAISRPSPGHGRAFVWDQRHGTRDLREVLLTDHGFSEQDLPKLLEAATGISADGLTIVGSTNPVNPEPGGKFAWAIYLDNPLVSFGLDGDCDGDGVLGAGDLACVSTIAERDNVLAALNTLPGDLDGDGSVAFSDFLVLSTNFGQDLPSYADGNIDRTGGVAFADFVVLSANFGKTPAAGAGTAAAVPEPSSSALLGFAGLLLGLVRRRRR